APSDVSAGGSGDAAGLDNRRVRRDRRDRGLVGGERRLRDSRRRGRRRPGRDRRRLHPLPGLAVVKATALGAPRPVPNRLLPVAAGTGALLIALPIFLIAGWPLGGWAVAALLWV